MKISITVLCAVGLLGCGPAPSGGTTPPGGGGGGGGGGTVPPGGGGGGGALTIGGSSSNFGRFGVTPGFLPDPHDQAVVSGGQIDARTLGMDPSCVGWVTQQPDYIMDLTSATAFLRVYVTSDQGEDTTLLINDGAGGWHCNDDSFGGRNPSVEIPNAPPGQYDIWVGSYQQGVQAHGTLHITEIESNHP